MYKKTKSCDITNAENWMFINISVLLQQIPAKKPGLYFDIFGDVKYIR